MGLIMYFHWDVRNHVGNANWELFHPQGFNERAADVKFDMFARGVALFLPLNLVSLGVWFAVLCCLPI